MNPSNSPGTAHPPLMKRHIQMAAIMKFGKRPEAQKLISLEQCNVVTALLLSLLTLWSGYFCTPCADTGLWTRVTLVASWSAWMRSSKTSSRIFKYPRVFNLRSTLLKWVLSMHHLAIICHCYKHHHFYSSLLEDLQYNSQRQ